MQNPIDRFLTQLKNAPTGSAIFNPWYESDSEHDFYPDAPSIRRANLRHYLTERLDRARYLLIAEAIGYQGAHFSGIAMTSERMLLGHQRQRGILPEYIMTGHVPRRTSRPDLRATGFSEPTATITWSAMLEFGIDSYRFVLWNAFPWHPYHPDKGLLSNRTPTRSELALAQPALLAFFELFPAGQVLAIGRKSAACLELLAINHRTARHPANGGAKKFRQNLHEFIYHSQY